MYYTHMQYISMPPTYPDLKTSSERTYCTVLYRPCVDAPSFLLVHPLPQGQPLDLLLPTAGSKV